MSQYLVGFRSLCWISDGHTLRLPIQGLLPPTGIEPTPFRNLASKVAGLQVHATTTWAMFVVHYVFVDINNKAILIYIKNIKVH